jgi:cell wall-associated NlpC family hydrolase
MAKIPGLPVAFVVIGGVLVWSGIENQPVTAIFRSLASGKAPAKGAPETFATAASATAGVTPGVPGGTASLGTGSGAAIAARAETYAGRFPYVWGGAPASGGSDCSGFANWVIGHDEGLAIPSWKAGGWAGTVHGPTTVSWLAWTGCTTVGHDGNAAQPGDLAVWQTHMGICLGPNQMISAQDPQNGTQISAINGFIPEILFIRRLRAVSGA